MKLRVEIGFFDVGLEPLPNILQRKYGLLRDLDKSLQGINFIKVFEFMCDI